MRMRACALQKRDHHTKVVPWFQEHLKADLSRSKVGSAICTFGG